MPRCSMLLTFNQVVDGSIPSGLTRKIRKNNDLSLNLKCVSQPFKTCPCHVRRRSGPRRPVVRFPG
jgi:hypothetical protein